MGDFDDLLHQVNAAHVLALQRLEWQNQVLTAEIAEFKRAHSKEDVVIAGSFDIDRVCMAPPELIVEPKHFSPQHHQPLSPRPESSDRGPGSGSVAGGSDEGSGYTSPSRKMVDTLWNGFRRLSDSNGSLHRRLAPGIRDPNKVERGSENLYFAVAGLQRSVTKSLGPRALKARLQHSISKGDFALRAKKFVNSFAFDAFCALVITLNAIMVGIEVHALAKQQPSPEYSRIFDIAVVVWYSIELVLRLWADRCKQNLTWNFFDFLMLSAGITDLSTAMEHSPGNYTIVRFLRYVRVLRVFKMLKIGKTVNNYFIVFSKMTYCLLQSLPSLVSAATVVLISTYISAVVLTQMATDHRESEPDQAENTNLVKYYGSLDMTFYTLVKAIFNGQAWGELMRPLTFASSMATAVFLMYLMSTLLCLLNVIHGVFVDSTLQSTAHYKELMVAQAQQRKLMLMQHLRETFHEIDTDNSGYITVQEFDACLQTPGGRAFFEFLGLSTVEAYELFRLMDADASQTVDIDEFCKGCMHFMGEAKNFDIQCIIAENRQVLQKWNVFIDNFEKCIQSCLCAWHSTTHSPEGTDPFLNGSTAGTVSHLLRRGSTDQLKTSLPRGGSAAAILRGGSAEQLRMAPILRGGSTEQLRATPILRGGSTEQLRATPILEVQSKSGNKEGRSESKSSVTDAATNGNHTDANEGVGDLPRVPASKMTMTPSGDGTRGGARKKLLL